MLTLELTDEITEIEINLTGPSIGQFLEIGFDGTLTDGGTVGIFRRYINNAGEQIGDDVPLVPSWDNQTPAVINQNQVGGLTFEGLCPESKIVFKANGNAIGIIFLLGISVNA
jgi:hypothetical protein